MWALTLWAIVFTYACAHTSRPLPEVQAVGTFTYDELVIELYDIFGPLALPKLTGENVARYNTYRKQDHRAVNRWFQTHLSSSMDTRNLPRWTEGQLCVQFAQYTRALMQHAAALSGQSTAPPAIGWFIVRQEHRWGGVGPGGRHALNTYITGPPGSMQAWVLEPQTNHYALIAEQTPEGWRLHPEAYPNLPYIEKVILEL